MSSETGGFSGPEYMSKMTHDLRRENFGKSITIFDNLSSNESIKITHYSDVIANSKEIQKTEKQLLHYHEEIPTHESIQEKVKSLHNSKSLETERTQKKAVK